MSKLVDNLMSNPEVSRVLCIAIATEAQRLSIKIDSKELAREFNRLVRKLDRAAFVDECRQLERLGPDRYLKSAGRQLG